MSWGGGGVQVGGVPVGGEGSGSGLGSGWMFLGGRVGGGVGVDVNM